MVVRRELLIRWRYPDQNIIAGQAFPSGKPPFAPFPTITNLLNANLCPVAIYHDLLHGIENAFIRQYPLARRGELFHNFIAYLKLSLRSRNFELTEADVLTQQRTIYDLFLRFAQNQGFLTNEAHDLWRLYIEPWIRRKLQNGELQAISPNDQIFFELSVANHSVPFPCK
jgi:hypothetical protein